MLHSPCNVEVLQNSQRFNTAELFQGHRKFKWGVPGCRGAFYVTTCPPLGLRVPAWTSVWEDTQARNQRHDAHIWERSLRHVQSADDEREKRTTLVGSWIGTDTEITPRFCLVVQILYHLCRCWSLRRIFCQSSSWTNFSCVHVWIQHKNNM